MSLSLRLSLASLILVAISFSPLSFVFEESGSLMGGALQHFCLSLAQWAQGEISFYGGLRSLWADNAGLSAEISRLRGETARLKEIERENGRLREQLGLEPTLGQRRLILAQVVGLVSEQGGSVVVLDKGEADDVAVGDLVILGSYLVGEVKRVEVSRSLVMLLGDPRLSVAALDQSSPDRSRGIVLGSFGTKLRMEKILPEEQVEIGDLIVSSGLDEKVPRGLVLGQVTRVIFSPGDILKEAELELLFDLNKLEEVFIRKQ